MLLYQSPMQPYGRAWESTLPMPTAPNRGQE